MKRPRRSALVLAGAAGLTGLGVGVALVPASAAGTSTQAMTDRVTAIKNALTGLVKDGTITQAQADKVATTLDGTLPKGGPGFGPGHRFGPGPGFGPGFGPGADLDAAAGAIGISADDLRTALRSGKTLAQVAQTKGITQATLVDKLVAAAKTRIAAEVKAGRLTQAQADAISGNLKAMITREVTSSLPIGGHGPRSDSDGGRSALPPNAPNGTPSNAPSAGSTT